jgi:prepilin-type N-terminal cleavage/methylation domain-containing protein
MKHKFFQERAFTLIEILLAIAIVGVVMTTLYMSFGGSLTIIRNSTERAEQIRRIIVLQRIIQNDIQNINYPSKKKLRYFKITRQYNGDDPADRIDFVALLSQLSFFSATSPLREISYFLRPGGTTAQGVQLYKLYRREQLGIDDHPERGGSVSLLAEGVQSIKVEAAQELGSDKWQRKWDYRNKNSYPKGVRITIVVQRDNLPQAFRQVVAIGRVMQDKPKNK